jgi:hypothetical protein
MQSAGLHWCVANCKRKSFDKSSFYKIILTFIALSGHTRAATSGPASLWWNNHPFKGIAGDTAFSLSHNGIIWNVSQLRKEFSLNQTKIETDSYVCVQLIEHFGRLNFESLKQMAEAISGSYTITVLDDLNNIFIVRGENQIELIHLEKLGLFVFASTGSILERALKRCKLSHVKFDKIPIKEGEIIKLSAGGEIERSSFSLPLIYPWSSYCSWPLSYNTLRPYADNASLHELLEIAYILNVSTDEVQDTLDSGFSVDEILEMLESPNAPNNHLDFIDLDCNDDFEL